MHHYWIMLPTACNHWLSVCCAVLCRAVRVQPVLRILPDRWWLWEQATGRPPRSSRWRRPSAPTVQQSDPSTRTLQERLQSERRWTPDRPSKGRWPQDPHRHDCQFPHPLIEVQWPHLAKNRPTSWLYCVSQWVSSHFIFHHVHVSEIAWDGFFAYVLSPSYLWYAED